jgi:hypothetical protein
MIGPTVQTVLGRVKAKAMRMRDQRTAHARAVVYIDRWIKVNFEEEGSPAMGGSGWVPLKAATIKRRRHGKGKGAAGVRILQDVGWLKNKWKPYYSPMKVAYQSMMPYGIYHDSDKLPRKRLPQRRIVPRYKQVAATLRKIYLGYMKEVLSGRS